MRVNWILRLYPSAWRQRYREEMQALLDLHTVTAATALDLLFGALDAWLHPVHQTQERIMSQQFLDALIKSISHFDRFSTRAQMVVSLAGEEAQHFQHTTVGTEHLLLGLLREAESAAAHVLEALGITLERVRKAVEEAKGRGDGSMQGEMMLSTHAKVAIEMAMQQAERQFLPPGSSGELIGSLRLSETEAAKILQDGKLLPHVESLGVTLEQIRLALAESKGRGVLILFDQGSPANTPTDAAERRRHPLFRVDTEKLLLGLLRVPECTAVKILQDLGVSSLGDIRTLLYLERGTLPITYREYSPRFTKQARTAWRLAHEEARRQQDSYVGAHHLLVGLVAEGSGVAAVVLSQMGITLEKIRERVEPGYEAGDWSVPGEIKLQPYLKHVIELASNEARRRYHPSIGTGHLLLVLVRGQDDQGIEAGLLTGLGVDLDTLRTALKRALAEQAGTFEQEAEAEADVTSEQGGYASHASIPSIERGLQSRELDKTMLAVYPFTIEARSVLEDARNQAQAQRLAQIRPEHLLLGLAGLTLRSHGLVSKVLKDVGIEYARTSAAVENRSVQGVKPASPVLVQSALCRAYVLLAAHEAEQRDGPGAPIKSEHLLLGLLREEKGSIADLLGDLGTSVETVRTKLLESLNVL
jgi:ATP-dependent Clp protease ATP-binding subunit ClpC